MSKRLILILALVFVVGIAMAAYAEVQNVKVSGDLLMQGVARNNNLALTPTANSDTKQRAILSAVRVRIDADLTDNVSTTVRLLNERTWAKEGLTGSDEAPSATTEAERDTSIDLDLAYATLKEFLYSPLTMVVGRQELRYGNALVIGDIDGNSTASLNSNLPSSLRDLSVRKSFDAIKAILNYDPLVIDLVYAKIEENSTSLNNDVNLMGINAAYALTKDLNTEAYLWSRNRDFGSTGLTIAAGEFDLAGQNERLNTLGARAVYTGMENLILGLEGAWQFGDRIVSTTLRPDDAVTDDGTKQRVNASAIQLTSNYVIPRMQKYSPSIRANYTRLSGGKPTANTTKWSGWDAMFEDQAGGTIFNRIVGYSNAQLFNLGGSMKPRDDVTLKLDWYQVRLLQPYADGDVLIDLSGIAADPTTTVVADKKLLANEIDLGLTYDYTEDVQLGLNGGMYIAGPVYHKTNRRNVTQLIGSMKVTF